MSGLAKRCGLAVAVLGLVASAAGQARAGLVTFDDVVSNSGQTQVPNSWDYAGLNFSSNFFQGVWGNDVEQGAKDGTPVFISGYSETTITPTGGGTFFLKSFDIGLSFYTDPAATVTETLNYAGGGSASFVLSLTQSFVTIPVNSNLTSLVLSQPSGSGGYIALDNISYTTATPEPSSLVYAAVAGLAVLGVRRRRLT